MGSIINSISTGWASCPEITDKLTVKDNNVYYMVTVRKYANI